MEVAISGGIGAQRGSVCLQAGGTSNLEVVERLPTAQPDIETKMHCFKRMGERVRARTFKRQVVELHVRVALLNRFSQLGCPVTVAMDKTQPGAGAIPSVNHIAQQSRCEAVV